MKIREKIIDIMAAGCTAGKNKKPCDRCRALAGDDADLILTAFLEALPKELDTDGDKDAPTSDQDFIIGTQHGYNACLEEIKKSLSP